MGSSEMLRRFKMTLNRSDSEVIFSVKETMADIEIFERDEIE